VTARDDIVLLLPEAWRTRLLILDAPSRTAYLKDVRVGLRTPRLLDWNEHVDEASVVVAAAFDLSVAEVLVRLPPQTVVVAVDTALGPHRYRLGRLHIGGARRLRTRAVSRVRIWFKPGTAGSSLPSDLTAYLRFVALPAGRSP
jgi:hypothetical protein